MRPGRTSVALGNRASQGTKSPWSSYSLASEAPAVPLEPPSKTWTWPTAQIVRLPVWMAPGTTAFALVATEQVEPVATPAVVAHGTVTGNGVSATVPATFCAPP